MQNLERQFPSAFIKINADFPNLPGVYFAKGEQIQEPMEAGLFVRTSEEAPFKKVVSDDLDVMMFQVGEFGQLVKDDGIRATEHRVHKALGAIER
ncbi:hypothetical protein [Criblamydia sequanensis]|uniref:Uncharacterized protein n=1 Tax=Candidatus Criblamydia sequanensis CRIB-18 TaxID=1437425 RepID=A0A090D2Q9_9BACT|nr:hypothetical protein [Criblamydia sequanensis]CDR34845.1 hypothetical protein CSEC_2039 [Criblamydia sequanensis CRIB-18]